MKRLAWIVVTLAACADSDPSLNGYNELKRLEAEVEIECGEFSVSCDGALHEAERACMETAHAQNKKARLVQHDDTGYAFYRTVVWITDGGYWVYEFHHRPEWGPKGFSYDSHCHTPWFFADSRNGCVEGSGTCVLWN